MTEQSSVASTMSDDPRAADGRRLAHWRRGPSRDDADLVCSNEYTLTGRHTHLSHR